MVVSLSGSVSVFVCAAALIVCIVLSRRAWMLSRLVFCCRGVLFLARRTIAVSFSWSARAVVISSNCFARFPMVEFSEGGVILAGVLGWEFIDFFSFSMAILFRTDCLSSAFLGQNWLNGS